MCHLGPIQPRHTLDRLRGRPTRIRHGLRSNVDCLSLSSSPSPPPASFSCRCPSSAPSLLCRRGQRAARPRAQGAARSWLRTQRRACKRTATARSFSRGRVRLPAAFSWGAGLLTSAARPPHARPQGAARRGLLRSDTGGWEDAGGDGEGEREGQFGRVELQICWIRVHVGSELAVHVDGQRRF